MIWHSGKHTWKRKITKQMVWYCVTIIWADPSGRIVCDFDADTLLKVQHVLKTTDYGNDISVTSSETSTRPSLNIKEEPMIHSDKHTVVILHSAETGNQEAGGPDSEQQASYLNS